MKERIVGIDLGTTNSVAAIIEGGKPRVIPNAEGSNLTPSVVAFINGDRPLVGQLAKEQAVSNPQKSTFPIKRPPFISSIKRYMGSDFHLIVGEDSYSPVEISAMILKKVKEDLQKNLKEKVKKAVITVPAYFNDCQRQATKDAGFLAGLEVVRIINEPTAASLAYGLDRKESQTILVWDLGGGTFDVSILELDNGVFEVKAVNGNTHLGGDDWDKCLLDFLIKDLRERFDFDPLSDSITVQRLKEAAQRGKEELSAKKSTLIRVPLTLVGKKKIYYEIIFTRREFEELTTPLRKKLVAPTKQALADANLHPEEIESVILVGGATRMPAIQTLVKELIGKEPYLKINPDEIVAIGAAIQAGILGGEIKDVILVDVNPLSLGIETTGGLFTRLIPRNTPIPVSKSQIFTTAQDNQIEIDLHVLQGEREMAGDNITLDRFQLTGLPLAPRGEPKIEVTFKIDVNGIVGVSARDLYSDRTEKISVTPIYRNPKKIKELTREAKEHLGEDQRKREEVESQIRAKSMIMASEYLIRESSPHKKPPLTLTLSPKGRGNKEAFVKRVEKEILAVKKSIASGDKEKIKRNTEKLKKVTEKLSQQLKPEGNENQYRHRKELFVAPRRNNP